MSDLLVRGSEIDFQGYLGAIATTYAKWWQLYTLTDAAGKQQQVQELSPIFDFGLMVQTVAKEGRGERGDGEREPEKIERFSVLEGIRKYAAPEQKSPHVLLVGRPGSGKSTALARLMLEEATTQTSEISPSPNTPSIPVLVELRYWQEPLAELIHGAIARHDPELRSVPLERLLENALLLFDGVNELPSEQARSQLIAFRRNHPKIPMIFTTRDLGLGGDLGIEEKLEMQPLTEMQMQAFVRAYIPEKAEAMLRQLKERLRDFGKTPLLLWMLCEVFDQTPNQRLPNNLAEIFQIFTRIYTDSSVRKHEVAVLKGDVRPLSDRRLWKPALMHLASVMMVGKERVDFRVVIDRSEAERSLQEAFPNESFPVRDILDDLLKFHLLQYRTSERIEFRHQLIQEYYAAEALLERLPDLSDAELQREYFNYLKWTEPVALMLALVDETQALRVVRLALKVDWMLGARLAGEVKREFQGQTVGWVDEVDVPSWLKVELLGVGRSDSAIPGLLLLLEDADPSARWMAAYAFGTIGFDIAIPRLLQWLKDADPADLLVSLRVVQSLRTIGYEGETPKLIRSLKDPDSSVRGNTANASRPRRNADPDFENVVVDKLAKIHPIRTNAYEDAHRSKLIAQFNRKFYNYEIYQKVQARAPDDRPPPSGSTIYNINQLGNLNAGPVTIQGNQIGEQTP